MGKGDETKEKKKHNKAYGKKIQDMNRNDLLTELKIHRENENNACQPDRPIENRNKPAQRTSK